MTGLPGDIFQDIDEKGLDGKEILHRLMYLDEKIQHGLPMQKELEYQAIKLTLLKRLRERRNAIAPRESTKTLPFNSSLWGLFLP